MRKAILFPLLVLLAVVLGRTPAQPAAAPVKPVLITAVTSWFKDYPSNDAVWELQRQLERKSGGSLKIDWKGGPEIVSPFEAVDALSRGVFHMLNTSGAYYTQLVPEVVFLDYFDGPIKALRAAGVIDFFDKINQEKAGVKLLGVVRGASGYALYTRKPVTKLEDFKGLKIRATPTYVPLIKALGASPVTMRPGDIYTAMERGVVDGFAFPEVGTMDLKLHEVYCCMIRPPFWTGRTVLLMNLQAFQKLSPEHQKLLTDTMRNIDEQWVEPHFKKLLEIELRELVTKHGRKIIDLPEADARRYREIAYTENWKEFVPTSPKYGEQIKKLAEPFSKAWPPSY